MLGIEQPSIGGGMMLLGEPIYNADKGLTDGP